MFILLGLSCVGTCQFSADVASNSSKVRSVSQNGMNLINKALKFHNLNLRNKNNAALLKQAYHKQQLGQRKHIWP